ncbi:hypothetical protein RR46_08768 [Papilio xuthus]|uniref:Uncharacterized protein n=1 Tax=Papilio xuthus TaxID=66420 RepID=A0A194PRD2_PAPXU|nr:hypothetical protein RR46_08768 [Papilio xuthus]
MCHRAPRGVAGRRGVSPGAAGCHRAPRGVAGPRGVPPGAAGRSVKLWDVQLCACTLPASGRWARPPPLPLPPPPAAARKQTHPQYVNVMLLQSRASSSSSSGCLSDGGVASETAFDCEFSMGTIKRKPSMKPNIPLTWMTRQLKEMAEIGSAPGEEGRGDGGTLTRRSRPRPRDDATLKRHHTESSESAVYGTTVLRPAIRALLALRALLARRRCNVRNMHVYI